MLLPGVRVGAGAVVRNAILDKHVEVPPGAQVGVDPEADRARGFVVEDGLTVLAKYQAVPRAARRADAPSRVRLAPATPFRRPMR